MFVFQAVLSAGSGDHQTIRFLSGDVTPYNLEVLYAYVLERATDQQTSSRLRDVRVTVTGTYKESVLPEIDRRLWRLETQNVKVALS